MEDKDAEIKRLREGIAQMKEAEISRLREETRRLKEQYRQSVTESQSLNMRNVVTPCKPPYLFPFYPFMFI